MKNFMMKNLKNKNLDKLYIKLYFIIKKEGIYTFQRIIF
jgi:hypothetical protein